MHRVELKAFYPLRHHTYYFSVPNAPCGVESESKTVFETKDGKVPNAPCGVERTISFDQY